MPPRTQFLSKLIGLYCIVMAICMFLRGQAMVDIVVLMLRDAPLMFIIGVFAVLTGLAVVLTHNVWTGTAPALIVTVIGWLALIKGVLFLIMTPDGETALFLQRLHYAQFFDVYAVILLALGV